MFVSLLIWNVLLATLLAAIAALAGMTRYIRERPALKHWLWLIVLCKLVTPPLLPLPILSPPLSQPDLIESAAQTDESLGELTGIGNSREQSGPQPLGTSPVEMATDAVPQVGINGERSDIETSTVTPRKLLDHWRAALCSVWLTVAFVLGVRLLIPMYRLKRLLRRGDWENDRINALVSHEARRLGVQQLTKVCVIQARVTPLLWVSKGRSVVVFPETLLSELTDEQLSCVAAHELAHFRRRDHWSNGFVCIVGCLFWWNPVVWWARRELKFAQEACCDAIVIGGDPSIRRCYAETLLHVVDFIVAKDVSPQLAAGFGDAPSIERRFEMIANENVTHRLSRAARMLLTLSLIATCCYPVLAQTERELTQPSDQGPAQNVSKNTGGFNEEPRQQSRNNVLNAAEKRIENSQDLRKDRDLFVSNAIQSLSQKSNESPSTPDPRLQNRPSRRSQKSSLHGEWQVIGQQHRGKKQPSAFDEHVWRFDSPAATIATRWRQGKNWGGGENRYILDVTTTPHHLTIYGDNLLVQAIIKTKGDEMTVAHFGRSESARPKSFADQREEFGTLVVKTLKRMKVRNDGPSVPGRSQTASNQINKNPAVKAYALRYADAAEAAKLLTAMKLGAVRIDADLRTNRLIVSSDKNEFRVVDKVVLELDRATASDDLVILRLRGIDSKSAALIVGKTFADGENSPVTVSAAGTKLIVRGASKKTMTQIRNLLSGLEWLAESNDATSNMKKGSR